MNCALAADAALAESQPPLPAPFYAEHKLPSLNISQTRAKEFPKPGSDFAGAKGYANPLAVRVLGGGTKVGLAVAGAVALPALAVPFSVIALGSAIGLVNTVQSPAEKEEWDFIWGLF